ncbi:MAG: hypothetical protein ACK4KW_08165 [Gemmobacter sp.]
MTLNTQPDGAKVEPFLKGESGGIVSMPNPEQIKLPHSGFKTNDGLSEALRAGTYNIRILNRIDSIVAGLLAFDPEYTPAYITSQVPVQLANRNIYAEHIVQGRLHRFTCNGGASLTFKRDQVVRNIVLITNCEIKFESGVGIEDSIIVTTNADKDAISASSGLRVGRNDNCADGGGAQLISYGGMSFPSALQVYGSQLLAKKSINFAAQANGIQGASFVAGERIDGTSNMAMGFFGSGMDANLQAAYFRLTY